MQDLPRSASESDWVPLRTLIFLRWVAIIGQLGAMFVAQFFLNVAIPAAPALAIIGAAVVVNLLSIIVLPPSHRLSEREAVLMLLFDTAQLAALLAVTGGLDNPFALLIMVPAAIAASSLQTRSTVLLGGAAIVLVTLMTQIHVPLRLLDGTEIAFPPLLEIGYFLAIVIGVAFLGFYARRVAVEIQTMSDALVATQLALAREQKLTDLAGVVAATAHELGTPLATIKLVSTELAEDLTDPTQRDDALLIRDQADRCRDILRSMGRAGKKDLLLRSAPLSALLQEAAEPHLDRGKSVQITLAEGAQPRVQRRPEVIHGLRNLVQNGVDFAATGVWLDVDWTETEIRLRLSDDGPGYPPDMIGRIGDPFPRGRIADGDSQRRPGYEGMGLGLFIAKTLLERSGARITFANGGPGSARPGAVVEVIWPRAALAASDAALGDNQLIAD